MKSGRIGRQGFTLIEMLLAVSVGSLMLAAIVAASVCLQKSFNAVDDYFDSHLQQVRIVDYLSRDVKRAYMVTSSTSPQTVTCILPPWTMLDAGSGRGAAMPTCWLGSEGRRVELAVPRPVCANLRKREKHEEKHGSAAAEPKPD